MTAKKGGGGTVEVWPDRIWKEWVSLNVPHYHQRRNLKQT